MKFEDRVRTNADGEPTLTGRDEAGLGCGRRWGGARSGLSDRGACLAAAIG